MSSSKKFSILLAVSLFPVCAHAELTVSPLFSDHAVLQKTGRTPVWGTASPDERVTVTLGGVSATAAAKADGSWCAYLDLAAKDVGPYVLTVEGGPGSKKVVANDVLVGEVWLASGQSNMEWSLAGTNGGQAEIAASANPQVRQFTVTRKTSAVPVTTLAGKWEVAGPSTSGHFTAVGYYFSSRLQRQLARPIGLIESAWGGTPLEAWMDLDAFGISPGLKAAAEKSRRSSENFPNASRAYVAALDAWEKRFDRAMPPPADPAPFASPDASLTGWKPVHLPGKLSPAGLPDAGAIWLRRKLTLPPDVVSTHAPLDLGVATGYDTVYWNGAKLGETQPADGGLNGLRHYYLPPEMLLHSSEGVIAIRLAVPAGGAAQGGPLRWGSLSMDGEWLGKAERELPPLDTVARTAYPVPIPGRPRPQDVATYLYNGMIAPLIPAAIRGVIWYQGETNVDRAYQYGAAFPAMITSWRNLWGEGAFPFYLCQLPNFTAHQPSPGESSWAELRESQVKALSLPNTGMAVLIDVGDADNVHPRDKKTPGERLAAIALAKTYGEKVPFAGPSFVSMTIEGETIRVRFEHTDGGLTARALPAEYAPSSAYPDKKVPLVRNVPNSQLEGFAICGEDHVWKWAQATIDGDQVVARVDGLARPVAVRYAWANNPICNLYNGAGFPAAPFRSDDFRLSTADKQF